MKYLLILLMIFSLISCDFLDGGDDDDDSSGGGSSSVSIPDVTVTCSNSSASRCDASPDGYNGFVAIFDSSDELAALGTGVMDCDSSGCSLTVDTWVNESLSNITTFSSGSYTIGAYLDINDNASGTESDYLNAAETGTDVVCTSGSSQTINSSSSTLSVTTCANL